MLAHLGYVIPAAKGRAAIDKPRATAVPGRNGRRRTMRRTWMIGAALLIAGAVDAVRAHEVNLPAGAVRDRHELMEKIGKNAKVIGDAMKAGKFGPESGIVPAAQEISTSATKITGLFPPGSTDPKSRAKPEIWTNWKKFEEDAKGL